MEALLSRLRSQLGPAVAEFLEDHSLTFFLSLLALEFGLSAWWLTPREGGEWDVLSGVAIGIGTAALLNWTSGPLRERNSPAD